MAPLASQSPLSQSRTFSQTSSIRQTVVQAASSSPFAADEDLQHDAEPQAQLLPVPSPSRKSAKLAALHARLSLPARFPLETLSRCLIDASANPHPEHNNSSLALVGQDLLGYHTAEWLICNYPRLPMEIILAAQYGYVGPKTLDSMRREWGVETAAAPGPEVDPGLLQFTRVTPGNAMSPNNTQRVKDAAISAATAAENAPRPSGWTPNTAWHRGMSSRIVNDDLFGDLPSGLHPSSTATTDANTPAPLNPTGGTTVENAAATFVRALFGALYLHAGAAPTKTFHAGHVLSRHLPLHTLFNFKYPTRDLSRLCARESFESPVARLLSETGRHSRSPVFVVGVFSGAEKLGEGDGSSLDEARVRAAANALRSWYLYSPPKEDVVLPSEVEGVATKTWKAQMVDPGEIVT